jgi:transposase
MAEGYPTDLADAEWAVLEPLLLAAKLGGDHFSDSLLPGSMHPRVPVDHCCADRRQQQDKQNPQAGIVCPRGWG